MNPGLFERQILTRVQAQDMIVPGDRVVLAVSGGPDSISLLSLFVSWRASLDLVLWAVHVHHGLRGEEADQDANFVAQLCEQWGVECIQRRVNVREIFLENGRSSSLQAVGREARYQILREVGEEYGATKIALGHTLDDQAETVMMWMLRGAGSSGLAGMQAVRAPQIIRPLLQVSRDEIVAYLVDKGLAYREDSSNSQPIYFRNRIRHELMPVLKQFNPNITRVLSRQAEILREESRYLEQVASQALVSVQPRNDEQNIILHRSRLLALPLALQRRVLSLVFQQIGERKTRTRFDAIQCVLDRVVRGMSGASVHLPGIRVTREYEEIRFQLLESRGESPSDGYRGELPFPIPANVVWPPTGQRIEGVANPVSVGLMPMERHTAWFDTRGFSSPLMIRSWKPGDYFFPLGLGGKRKKVKEYFSDIKLGQSKRKKVPLLVAPEGILWVVGHRQDHRFRVTSSTQEVLVARITPELES